MPVYIVLLIISLNHNYKIRNCSIETIVQLEYNTHLCTYAYMFSLVSSVCTNIVWTLSTSILRPLSYRRGKNAVVWCNTLEHQGPPTFVFMLFCNWRSHSSKLATINSHDVYVQVCIQCSCFVKYYVCECMKSSLVLMPLPPHPDKKLLSAHKGA